MFLKDFRKKLKSIQLRISKMLFIQRTNLVFTIIIAVVTIIGVEAALSQLMIILKKDFRTILIANLIYWIILTLLFVLLTKIIKNEKL